MWFVCIYVVCVYLCGLCVYVCVVCVCVCVCMCWVCGWVGVGVELFLISRYKSCYLLLLFLESGSAICDYFISNRCTRGQLCPLRHVRGNQLVVCKHWLRGLCKKGDDCEFLHKYDMERMPECYFFIKYGTVCFCVDYKNSLLIYHILTLNFDATYHWGSIQPITH